jgi:hypothetical protein
MLKTCLAGLLLVFVMLTGCSNMQVVIPGANRAIFRDEFVPGHTGNWILEHDETGSTAIVPEQMLIEINVPNLVQYATLKEPLFSDFTLEVDGRMMSGSPVSSYGVLFRKQGPQQFYRFAITGDGMYTLERHDADGARLTFTGDWRDAASIKQGLGVTNHLKIVANGPAIALYVNDVLLDQFTDETYAEGSIALDAGTFNDGNLQVAFDNLILLPPQ